MTTCTHQNGGYSLTHCESLTSVVKPFSKSSTGVLFSSMTNINSGERLGTRIMIVKDRSHNGIVLGLCPFCGGALRDLDNDELTHLRDTYSNLIASKED